MFERVSGGFGKGSGGAGVAMGVLVIGVLEMGAPAAGNGWMEVLAACDEWIREAAGVGRAARVRGGEGSRPQWEVRRARFVAALWTSMGTGAALMAQMKASAEMD